MNSQNSLDQIKKNIWAMLFTNNSIKDELEENWLGTNAQSWGTEDILKSIKKNLNVSIDENSELFQMFKEFYDQQMMFFMLGYKSIEDYSNGISDEIDSGVYLFLNDLKNGIKNFSEEFSKLFNDYKIIKVRSSDGEFSNTATNINELLEIVQL